MARYRSRMIVLLSVIVVVASLFIILSGPFLPGEYDSEARRWAFGAVTTVVLFWMKPKS